MKKIIIYLFLFFSFYTSIGQVYVIPQYKYSKSEPEKEKEKDSLVYIGTFQYGLSGMMGVVITTSPQTPGFSPNPILSGNGGLFFSYPINKRFYLYEWMGLSFKGYKTNSITNTQNSLYFVENTLKGNRSILYLEKLKCIGVNLGWGFSLFAGPGMALRIREKSTFTSVRYFTPKDITRDSAHTVVTSYDQSGNSALDYFTINITGGIRCDIRHIVHLSARYTRDVAGLNMSSNNMLKNTLVNSGYYFVLEIPLYRNRLSKAY